MSSLDLELDGRIEALELEWRLAYEAGQQARAQIEATAANTLADRRIISLATAAQDLDSEPTANLLERRWFAAQAATRGLQAKCDLLLEALNLAQAAWQRAQNQLAAFVALGDALETQLAAMDMPSIPAAPEHPCRSVRSSAGPSLRRDSNTHTSIQISRQPQRADHQELDVLEEGRALAFDGVPDELANPCQHEQSGKNHPQRHAAAMAQGVNRPEHQQ
jgi:hypothetical protein